MMFKILCSTSNWNALGIIPNTSNSYLFKCFRASFSTKRFQNSCAPKTLIKHKCLNYSCAPEPLAQQKYQILMCSGSSCSTQTSITHVLHRFFLNKNIKYLCAPELLTQHKHQILMCLRSRAQHKHLINYVL